MTDEAAPAPSIEAVFDPGWEVYDFDFDGIKLCALRLQHPRHGAISLLLPVNEAEQMADALRQVVETIRGTRGKWTSSATS